MSSSSRLRKQPGLNGLPAEGYQHRAGPFLKWAGGKSQLLQTYEQFFPKNFKSYHEPFTGGGAVFFHLRNTRSSFRATLSDLNEELINCYATIRDDVETLIEELRVHSNDEEYFYTLRALDPLKLSNSERAARLIYLNKTCFNGLYRVNRRGNFNVPFGFYKNPKLCDDVNLRACSRALQDVSILHDPFHGVLERARKGDFIYFDPPYQPLTTTANFTSYTKGSFSEENQDQLARVFAQLAKKGCLVMLSNSDTPLIRNLYAKFNINTVYALRAINCKADGRGPVPELLITSY